jgi:hypothetical protein
MVCFHHLWLHKTIACKSTIVIHRKAEFAHIILRIDGLHYLKKTESESDNIGDFTLQLPQSLLCNSQNEELSIYVFTAI